jgi:hypothetical protein
MFEVVMSTNENVFLKDVFSFFDELQFFCYVVAKNLTLQKIGHRKKSRKTEHNFYYNSTSTKWMFSVQVYLEDYSFGTEYGHCFTGKSTQTSICHASWAYL